MKFASRPPDWECKESREKRPTDVIKESPIKEKVMSFVNKEKAASKCRYLAGFELKIQ